MVVFTRERYPEGKDEQIIPFYKGPLSTFAEWHALATGFKHGLTEWKGREPTGALDLPGTDAHNEPHFYNLGYTAGTLTRWLFIAGLAILIYK